MIKRTIYLFIIISFIAFSCEKEISMKIPDKGRKIVLNSIITDNRPIIVELTKSLHILDNQNSFSPLKGAEVKLYENDIFIETLIQSLYHYKSSYLPQKGKIYTIKATYENDSVNSKTIIPYAVPVTITDHKIIDNEENYLRISIQIDDPSDLLNYYMIEFYIWDTLTIYHPDTTVEDTIIFQKLPIIGESEMVEDSQFECIYQNSGILSDEKFNGKQFKITVNVDYQAGMGIKNTVYACLKSISYDKYMYMRTLSAYDQLGYSPFTEPVMVYNNINNGYGIFAGYSASLDSVIIF